MYCLSPLIVIRIAYCYRVFKPNDFMLGSYFKPSASVPCPCWCRSYQKSPKLDLVFPANLTVYYQWKYISFIYLHYNKLHSKGTWSRNVISCFTTSAETICLNETSLGPCSHSQLEAIIQWIQHQSVEGLYGMWANSTRFCCDHSTFSHSTIRHSLRHSAIVNDPYHSIPMHARNKTSTEPRFFWRHARLHLQPICGYIASRLSSSHRMHRFSKFALVYFLRDILFYANSC